jgi:TPR repeat protein
MPIFRNLYVKLLCWGGRAIDIRLANKYPSNMLSNLCEHVFVMDGIRCRSMEGFLQSLKVKDREEQRRICSLSGKEAKRSSTEEWKARQILYWQGGEIRRESPDFKALILRAYSFLFAYDKSFREALLSTRGKILCHTLGKQNPKETILTEKEFCDTLAALRDPESMVKLMESFIAEGYYKASYDLGQMYLQGNGVEEDTEKAIHYFTQSAENGMVQGAYQLGCIYQGTDEEKSFEWYRKAAEAGLPEALNNVGSCYFFGRGTDIDYERAFQSYKASAEKGNVEGAMNTGICYASGKGVALCFEEAFRWWTFAAEQGHVKAMVNLVTCYNMGYGTEKNLTMAIKWCDKAAELGDPVAEEMLDHLK